MSPTAAERRASGEALARDLSVSGAFGYIADVRPLGRSEIAVLDRQRACIIVLDSLGKITREIGGPGAAVGQFHSPVALAVADKRLLVLDPFGPAPLTKIDGEAGGSFAVPDSVWGVGWQLMVTREPLAFVSRTIGVGVEDVASRLGAIGDSAFIVQPEALGAVADAGMGLLSYVSAKANTPERSAIVKPRGVGRNLPERPIDRAVLFDDRIVWAAGTGWVATAHTEGDHVDIRDRGGRITVTWPAADGAVSSTDRDETAAWFTLYTIRVDAVARRNYAALASSRRVRDIDRFARSLTFAKRRPSLVKLLGDGECLWLDGWQPADGLTAQGRTWLRLDLRDFSIAVVRLPHVDVHVTAVADGEMYAQYTDSLGVTHVERYPVGRC